MTDKRQSKDDDSTDAPEPSSACDPRPVSDAELREQVSREQVEDYRRHADKAHQNWFSVMNNPYGKD